MRNEISTAKLIDRNPFRLGKGWFHGHRQAGQQEARKILAEHKPEPLVPEIIQKIDAIIAKAEKEKDGNS
jgi:trimethylamine:corrinoid methyltransferase-like protein